MQKQFQFQQPNPGPWLVRTRELVPATGYESSYAEELFEQMEAKRPQWATDFYQCDDKIIATYEHRNRCEDIEVAVTTSSTAAGILDEMEAAFEQACKEIDREDREYEHPRHTQGY